MTFNFTKLYKAGGRHHFGWYTTWYWRRMMGYKGFTAHADRKGCVMCGK